MRIIDAQINMRIRAVYSKNYFVDIFTASTDY